MSFQNKIDLNHTNDPPIAKCKWIILDVSPHTNSCKDTVYAIEFDDGSYDPDGDSLTYGIQLNDYCTNTYDSVGKMKIAECEYTSGIIKPVIFWVFDTEGRSDSCSTYIYFNDPTDHCWYGYSYSHIYCETKDGNVINNFNVYIDSFLVTTNVNGSHTFHHRYLQKIHLTKESNPLNGISTLDIILLRKHILGHEPFTHFEQWIAADVNLDQKVSLWDILYLRLLIFNMTDNFPHNQTWRFYDAEFTTDSDFPLGENIPYTIIDSSRCGGAVLTFYGVKIGDISGNASPIF